MNRFAVAMLSMTLGMVGAAEVWSARKPSDFDGKPPMTPEGVFQQPANRRLISMKRFAVNPAKKYIISGEFRLVGASKSQAFFLGFVPLTADGKKIEARNCRFAANTTVAEVAAPAAAGATEIFLKKAPRWAEAKNGYLALNAKANASDLPNFSLLQAKSIRDEGENTIVTLARPLGVAMETGTFVRLHKEGPSFLYSGANARFLKDQWETLTGTIQFDKGAIRWYPGTAQAAVVLLPAAKDGTLEFRNLTVTETDADAVVIRDGEADIVKNGAVITVSDSAEKAQYRPASMYDGKPDTAWMSGAAQNDHDIDVHWFKRNVSLSGVWLNLTPVEYNYTRDSGYFSRLANIIPEKYEGKSTLPKSIKVECKQYGKWRELGTHPVNGNLFFYRFPEVLHDIQRLRLSFVTEPGQRVAIREIQLPAPPTPSQSALKSVPRLSSGGAYYIWPLDGTKLIPHAKAVTGYFRTPFSLAGKQPEEAILIVAAYNQAEMYLNGQKLFRTPLTVQESKPEAIRFSLPVALLKEKNILACIADKTDIASGLFGVIYRLAIRYADGSVQYVESAGKTTTATCKTPDSPDWLKSADGFADWKPAHNRYQSAGYPSDYWAVDASEPFFPDEVELLSCKLTPEIPKGGDAYRLELDFNLPSPLKNAYRVTVRYGEMPLELYGDYSLGTAISMPEASFQPGDRGKKRCVITGSWPEEVSPCLPVRLAVANGRQQAFIRSKIGDMLPSPVNGQVALHLGDKFPTLPKGFPKAEVKEGRYHIDGKPAGALFIGANRMSAGRVADQLDHDALKIIRINKVFAIAPQEYRKDLQDLAIKLFEHAAHYTLSKNPNAKFLLPINLDPIAEWLFANPDEQIELGDGSRLMGFYNNRGTGNIQVKASLASEEYRKIVYDSVYELVTRLKNHPLGNSVAAISLALGLASENNWGVDRYDFTKGKRTRETCITGDFGPAARKGFIRFLDKRYGTDADFAKAWKLPPTAKKTDLLSFDIWPHSRIQNILLWKDRPQDRFIFRDGQKDGRAAEDLGEYCSITRAELLLVAAKAVKDASERHLIVGSYAGYVFPQLVNNPVGSSVYSGHAASKMLRESPDFDYFSAPHYVHTLDLPMFYSVLNDSLEPYGKMFIAEADIRTHVAQFGSMYSRKEMLNLMRKFSGSMLTKNFGAWFIGWSYSFAGPKGVRYFSDPAVLNELKCLREECERPAVREPAAGNRIALLVSEQSSWYMDLMSPANTIHASMFYKNLHKFLRTGAGCDIMALEDLPQLVKTGRINEYRFIAFYNAFHLNAELRRIINTTLKSDGRTLLFFYAPGVHDDDFNRKGSSLSTEGIADILGVKKVSMLKEEHIIGAKWNGGETVDCTIWWDVHQKAIFSDKIGPVFYLEPADGIESLATLRMDEKDYPDKIAAARIKGRNHTVIYVAVPNIPRPVLNTLVRNSGTVIAADGDVSVNANKGYLVVSNQEQARNVTVRSAYKADWFELPGNTSVATNVTEVTLPFGFRETRLFRLVPRQ